MRFTLKCPPEGRLGGRARSFNSSVDLKAIVHLIEDKVKLEAINPCITFSTDQQHFDEVLKLLMEIDHE